jgi:hypothetical protein
MDGMSQEAGQGGLERRVYERVDCQLGVSWRHLDKTEADLLLQSGSFTDVFMLTDLQSSTSGAALEAKAYTENLSVSGVKLVGDLRLTTSGEAMQDGWELLVELQVPGAPIPVRALAVVVWSSPSLDSEGHRSAGLFFKAIHKQDVERVTRYIVLQKRAQHG